MNYSIIVPAHNEDEFIARGLEAIRQAEVPMGSAVEIIVVLNRCTDRTEEIARSFGAKIVRENARVLSKIRNAGAAAAVHDVIVTIDADSRMSPNMLVEIKKHLASGRYIGGGAWIDIDRTSVPILLTFYTLRFLLFLTGLSGGLYWCRKKDFDAIGGFDERLDVAEDLDFARRLKKYGRRQNKKLHEIRTARITTSARKFDTFGDWYMLRLIYAQM